MFYIAGNAAKWSEAMGHAFAQMPSQRVSRFGPSVYDVQAGVAVLILDGAF